MSVISEFKEFISRGNVIDMAVGIAVGTAFTNIVTVLVDKVIMPPVGLLVGGIDFTQMQWVLKAADADGEGGVAIGYGALIDATVTFLIIAFAIFMLVKGINRLHRKKEEEPAEPEAPPADVVLLTEIRDLLQKQKD